METQLPKILVAESDDFKVWVELDRDNTTAHLHSEVVKFTPRILREGYKIFAEIERQAIEAGLKTLVTFTPNPRFAKLFGGETVSSFSYNEINYEVVVWDLKQVSSP